jgi:predicted RNase H-like HicB family nuclease
MIEEYLEAVMKLAHYELLAENEGFYASIPGARGVWGNAQTLEECRDEFHSALEEWVLLLIRLGHELPEFNGIRLELPKLERAQIHSERLARLSN